MDFAAYVEARRAALVRAGVLLGHDLVSSTAAVDRVLVRRGRAIGRSEHPDPDVYAALVRELGPTPDAGPAPTRDAASTPAGQPDPATRVREALAGLDPEARCVAVLVLHADLTPRETGAALGLTPTELGASLAGALVALGVTEEIDARELVALAAEEIAVGAAPVALEPAPVDRRPALLVAAGAAVVALAVTAALLTGGGGDDVPPDDDERPTVDRVPSLFAYDIDGARGLLESQGLEVTEERVQICEPADHVVGSDPPTGARVPIGSEVTILTAFPENSCLPAYFDRSDAWDFIDFATGRGPAPPFAPSVRIVVDEGEPFRLTAGEAAIRAAWGSPSVLSEVANATEQVARTTGDRYLTPVLGVRTGVPPAQTCGVDRPAATGRRQALRITIAIPAAPVLCPLTVDLYRADDAIDTVVLYTQKAPVR